MKTKIIIAALLLMCLVPAKSKAGGIPILYQTGEEIEPVTSIYTDDGYVHVGVFYHYVKVFWLPLVNTEKKYVIYQGNSYQELSNMEIEYLCDYYDLPFKPRLPFWQAWGGKLVLLLILAGGIWIKMSD